MKTPEMEKQPDSIVTEVPSTESILHLALPSGYKGTQRAKRFQLNELSVSGKLLATSILCLLGLTYLALLASIWFDTEMSIPVIAEGYGSFGTLELVQHTLIHLPWFVGTFGVLLGGLMCASCPESLKRVAAVLLPTLILCDFVFMWLVRTHSFFSVLLFGTGFTLAFFFLILFLYLLYELWRAPNNN